MAAPTEQFGDTTEFHHQLGLTEWFINRKEGIEHGYTVSQRPAWLERDEEVTFEVTLAGAKAQEVEAEDGSRDLAFFSEEYQVEGEDRRSTIGG